MAQSGQDNVNHHDFHYQRAESEAARGRVEDQATNLHLLRSLITESLNDARAKNVAGRPPYDMKQSALSRCFKESMRWTTKQSSFVQRLDEREQDEILRLFCQPHIDLVLISDDCWDNGHIEGCHWLGECFIE